MEHQTKSQGPNPTVVVYDGMCRFCCEQIERIRGWDPVGQFEYVPSQREGLIERFPILRGENFDSGLRVLTSDGKLHIEADAAYQIARRLPYWVRIAWAYRLPGIKQICRAIYRLIARNRRRLGRSCAGGACRLDGER